MGNRAGRQQSFATTARAVTLWAAFVLLPGALLVTTACGTDDGGGSSGETTASKNTFIIKNDTTCLLSFTSSKGSKTFELVAGESHNYTGSDGCRDLNFCVADCGACGLVVELCLYGGATVHLFARGSGSSFRVVCTDCY